MKNNREEDLDCFLRGLRTLNLAKWECKDLPIMPEAQNPSPFAPPTCDINQTDSCRAGQLFSIKSLVILSLIWLALIPIQSWQSLLSIALVMLTWLFGCPKTRRATILVLWLMFIPAVLLWIKAKMFGFSQQLNQEIGTAFLSVEANIFMVGPFNGLILFGIIFLIFVTVIRFFPKVKPLVVAAHALIICGRAGLALILGNC